MSFRKKLLAGLFAPVLALSVGTVFAQSSPGGTPSGGTAAGSSSTGAGAATTGTAGGSNMRSSWDADAFKRLDKNGDGMLSREEAQADATIRDAWSRLDTGNKGSVSLSDFERYGKTHTSK
jgi:hypothetical protein